jgi:hypothetical protein
MVMAAEAIMAAVKTGVVEVIIGRGAITEARIGAITEANIGKASIGITDIMPIVRGTIIGAMDATPTRPIHTMAAITVMPPLTLMGIARTGTATIAMEAALY